MKNKLCSSCHKVKKIDNFYKSKKSLSGLRSWCKHCCDKGTYRYRKEHPGVLNDIEHYGGNRQKALERDHWTCQICGMSQEEHIYRWGRGLTVDHIDGQGRYSKVKNNDLNNLQTLCLSCHGRKDKLRGLAINLGDSK